MNEYGNGVRWRVKDEMWSVLESGGGDGGGGAAPCARGKHSATILGGFVYVLGGRGAGGNLPLRDFWRYSLESGEWEKLECHGSAPPWLQEHSATAHDGKLYVFGGEAGALSTETPLWIYDAETQYWRKLPGSGAVSTRRTRDGRGGCGGAAGGAGGPRGRRGHSAHALKDCLLIYGGYKDLRGSTNELWAFHYESESWQQVRTVNAGPARHRHAAALLDASLLVHGGLCDLRVTADLWLYDTLSRMWSQIRTPAKASPGARAGHAAARVQHAMYVFGGEADAHPTNDMWRFHFASEQWERIVPSLKWPAPRVDACALLLAWPPTDGDCSDDDDGSPAPAPLAHPAHPAHPASILREITKLGQFHMRRAARCSYTVLGERDSNESKGVSRELGKSASAHALGRRSLARSGRSVPDFGDARADRADRTDRDSGDEAATSGYGSAERLGFANPHYDAGAAPAPAPTDLELRELRPRRAAPAPAPARRLLLVGGREVAHVALLQSPLSMWTYKLS